MLQFLVTSKARRRLLALLWGEKKRGSVAELAQLAHVSFASAHAELKKMQRLQLVNSNRETGRDVISANPDHPEAELLSRLVRANAGRSISEPTDEALKRKLVFLGARLRGVKPSPVGPSEILGTLVEGAELARRDAVVARSMPLSVWKQREHLNAKALQGLDASPEEKHALAFLLELAGQLGGDRRLTGLAEGLRDQRLTQLRDFSYATRSGLARDFPLAKKWGFSMNTELDWFRSLFDKLVTT